MRRWTQNTHALLASILELLGQGFIHINFPISKMGSYWTIVPDNILIVALWNPNLNLFDLNIALFRFQNKNYIFEVLESMKFPRFFSRYLIWLDVNKATTYCESPTPKLEFLDLELYRNIFSNAVPVKLLF